MTTTFSLTDIDNELSNRHIDLDPQGYFIVYLDREKSLLCVDHYTNDINEQGLAVDPETGEVIACKNSKPRQAKTTYTAQTAKQMCVKLIEESDPMPLSMMDHAAYLGRELMRAEFALVNGTEYIQD